ncbi:MAG: N-formylglutamate amidohydrolase [Candidatus Omnitrophota bacterium]
MRKILITCEHGANTIPFEYKKNFIKNRQLLDSHRGYDRGAIDLYNVLKKDVADKAFICTVSRLLVDVNRSLHNPKVFSFISREFPAVSKQRVIAHFYAPYRNSVESAVAAIIKAGNRVVHFSVHSFTPVFNHHTRNADMGLLYDPRREAEKELCQRLAECLNSKHPELAIRFNYPYKGISDGGPAFLRSKYPEPDYCGIELEVNQKIVAGTPDRWKALQKSISACIKNMVIR